MSRVAVSVAIATCVAACGAASQPVTPAGGHAYQIMRYPASPPPSAVERQFDEVERAIEAARQKLGKDAPEAHK